MDSNERSLWLDSLKQNARRSSANWWITLILSLVLGCFGADRFYLGRPILGVVKLCSAGGGGAWWLIDLVLLCANRMKDDNGAIVRRPF